MADHISLIANQLSQGRIGFLIGAGMSIPSGGMSGSDLAFQLVWKALFSSKHEPLDKDFKKQLEKVSRKFPLEAIAAGVIKHIPFGESQLVEILKTNVFRGNEPQISSGHLALSALVSKFDIKTLYTTNWDTLLKESLGDQAEVITEHTFRNLENVYSSGKTAIIHLHGTFEDHPLIKEEDIMAPDRPLLQLFLADLISKAFVFVGYSVGDHNIRTLYSKSGDILSKRSTKLEKRTYIISPPDDDVDKEVSENVWDARKATYLPLKADEFFKLLLNEAVTNAIEIRKEKLQKRLNISPQDLSSKIEEIVNLFPEFENPEQVVRYLEAITRGGRP